jgi:hypothetical protein
MRVIFDIDNCLADDEWRLKYIDWSCSDLEARYAQYHAKSYADKPANLDKLARHVARGHRLTFFTSRPVSIETQTRGWIEHALGIEAPMYDLFMRNSGDHRHGVDVKQEMLRHLANPNHGYVFSNVPRDIVCAYDDREDIVRMYASHGIMARRLAIHERCALTPPPAPAPEPRGAAAVLADMAKTFAERNAVYKDNYKTCAKVLDALYPEGLTAKGADQHEVLHLWSLLLVKVTRFVHSGHTHTDSLHDIAVYAAMIESILKEQHS